MVKTALIKKYHVQFSDDTRLKEMRSEKMEASDYLEKIFQVPFHLYPASDQSVKNMIAGLLPAGPAKVVESVSIVMHL